VAGLDVERRNSREDDDRPAVVDLAPERSGEHQRPDDLGVERAPHGVALEVADHAAGARRGGRDDVVNGAHSPSQASDRVVVGQVDRLRAHARVMVVGVGELLGVAAGGGHRRPRGAGRLRDRSREPAAAADHQHLLVLQR
jgi:hypothetical protein